MSAKKLGKSFKVQNRKIHYWITAIVFFPFLLVLTTGILLQLKKQIEWVQPSTVKGESQDLTLSFEEILERARLVDSLNIDSWQDIERLDVRPSKGMVKIKTKNNWEVQMDLKSGAILKVAYRRSDLIESLHDGSFFFSFSKLWIFLPNAILVLVMLVTGGILFLLSFRKKLR